MKKNVALILLAVLLSLSAQADYYQVTTEIAPGGGSKFSATRNLDGSYTPNVNCLGSGGSSTTGRSSVALARNVYSSTNVTTSAYVQIVAALSDAVNSLNIFDSSGQLLVLAVGASGAEVDQLYITPGGNGNVDLAIASGSRVSVKAVTATASAAGTYLAISFLK